MDLAANDAASPQVRAVATQQLHSLLENYLRNAAVTAPNFAEGTHRVALSDDIERFLARPDAPRRRTTPPPTPPGDPIGAQSPP